MEDAHLLDFDGCMVAVDSNGWIYSGARKCARNLVLKIPTRRYLDYFLDRVEVLLAYGVIPTLVFDGAPLPAKLEENLQRDADRKESLTRALQLESAGYLESANAEFKKALKVTPQMVNVIVQELKRRGIDYIISPHEADAQLAYLSKTGNFDAIISEDSDMIPYGCKRVLFQLDWDGFCDEYKSENLSKYNEICERKKKHKSLDLSSFSHDQIITMCVFAGCDYLESVNGIKLGRAYQLARDYQNYSLAIEAENGSTTFPDDYSDSFHRAIMTYKHQVVYDRDSEEFVHLSEVNDAADQDLDYLGKYPFIFLFLALKILPLCVNLFSLTYLTLLPKSVAKQIATGEINPCTGLRFEGEEWLSFKIEEEVVAGCPKREIMGLKEAEEERQMLVSKSILLEDTWKAWWNNPCVASSSSSIGSSIHTVCTFGDLIRIYNIMPRASQLVSKESIFCFRKGTKPEWEDPECAEGGRWIFAMAKSQAESYWLRVLQAILGEEFDEDSSIYGASVNLDFERMKIAIWTKNAVNKELQISIGKQFKKMLNYKYIAGYIFHEDAKSVEKGAKNKYTV